MASITFYLPLGIEQGGVLHRKGTMRRATTEDELSLQELDETGLNSRYRDVILFSKIIEDIDGLAVTQEVILDLYEADFLYLQLLYRKLSGNMESKAETVCPECGARFGIEMETLYKDMSVFK